MTITLDLLSTPGALDNPHRVGKPLARELARYHSARRGRRNDSGTGKFSAYSPSRRAAEPPG